MPFSRKAVQIDFIASKLRDSAGGALSGAVVVAYDPFAKDSAGVNQIYRRKPIWDTASKGSMPLPGSQVVLDAEGYGEAFGDGTYDFRVYPDLASVPAAGDPLDPFDGESIAGAIDERLGYHYSDEIVNVVDYGAVPDGGLGKHGTDPADPLTYRGTDNTRAFQAAIDYCLSTNASPRRLFVPAGVYRITETLRLAKPAPQPPDVVAYQPASMEIFGEKRNIGYGADSIIYAEFDTGPALAIQAGQGVRIKDLAFEGVNTWFDTWQTKSIDVNGVNVTDDSYLINDLFNESGLGTMPGCYDSAHAPYAAIAIDPFSLGQGYVTVTGGGTTQPTMDKYYVTTKGSNQSTSISLEGCSFSRFVVGVVISPTGIDANAEDISIRECAFTKNKIAIASGQSQARNFNVENITVYGAQFCFDTRTYGNGRGVAPNVRGANIGATKYIFNIGTQGQTAWFEQIYCERCLGLGFVGAGSSSNEQGAHFVGCNFNFAQSLPAIDTHPFNFAHVHFEGCSFRVYRYDINLPPAPPPKVKQRPPLSFTNFAPLTFTECVLGTLDLQGPDAEFFDSNGISVAGSIPMGFLDPNKVVFHRFKIADGTLPTTFSYLDASYPAVEDGGFPLTTVPPGAIVHSQNGSGQMRVIGGGVQEILLRIGAAITVKKFGNEGVFNLGLNGVLRVGDVVYSATTWQPEAYPDAPTYLAASLTQLPSKTKSSYPTVGVCGMVTSIFTGSPATATLSFIPETLLSMLPKDLVLYVKRFCRYHQPSTGTVLPNGPTINPVANYNRWRPGDRIRAHGLTTDAEMLLEGTYVIAISSANGGTIQLSRKAIDTMLPAEVARLYDANAFVFTGTPE